MIKQNTTQNSPEPKHYTNGFIFPCLFLCLFLWNIAENIHESMQMFILIKFVYTTYTRTVFVHKWGTSFRLEKYQITTKPRKKSLLVNHKDRKNLNIHIQLLV